MSSMKFSRRDFARLSAAAGAVVTGYSPLLGAAIRGAALPALTEFGYGDVTVDSALHQAQLQNTHDVLMSLSDDSLLKPFRQLVGQRAPGEDLGGWYNYDPNYNWHTDDAGFAPGATFGQWVSALARYYAITGSQPARAKVQQRVHHAVGAELPDRWLRWITVSTPTSVIRSPSMSTSTCHQASAGVRGQYAAHCSRARPHRA
jgi:hypothetical protein